MPTKMKMKVDKLVTGINVVLRWTCALWSSEIEMKGHFEVSLPHPGVIDFSWPISTVTMSLTIPTESHSTHTPLPCIWWVLLSADWGSLVFHDARSTWLERLLKHLWPVVFSLIHSSRSDSNYGEMSLWRHEIDSETQPTARYHTSLSSVLSRTHGDNVYYATVGSLLYL